MIMNALTEEKIKSARNIAVFGAQAAAYGVFCAVNDIYGKCPACYIVSKQQGNPNQIDGVNVLTIEQALCYRNYLIIVAAPAQYHEEISSILDRAQFDNICVLDPASEYDIMRMFFRRKTGLRGIKDFPISQVQRIDIDVCMAKSNFDRPLKEQYRFAEYIAPVHAGAALSNKRIADRSDDTGKNISIKNRNYSELTVTYWVWKNSVSAYKGICHYRRFLNLDADALRRVPNVDVVLPLPFWCYPDASSQYERYINTEDFDVMMRVLRETNVDYYESALLSFKGSTIYNYNMLIAKRAVFDSYCTFLFGILEKVETHYENIGRKRDDRYLGYIGELLTSIYFNANASNLKIAHAPREWLV